MDKVGKVLNLFMDEKIFNEIAFGEVRKLALELLEEDKFGQLSFSLAHEIYLYV